MMAMMVTLTYLQLRHFGGAAFQLHCILTSPCHHEKVVFDKVEKVRKTAIIIVIITSFFLALQVP